MKVRPRIVPLGDSALLVRLGNEIDIETNQQVHSLVALLDAFPPKGVIESVPAYTTVLIRYDPLLLSYGNLLEWIRSRLDRAGAAISRKSRLIEVPVQYGGEYGVDLESVAAHHQLQVEDVIQIHSGTAYRVYMMGFTPGFPYMGKLEDEIAMPRLETPRTRVPAGTVAIAGSQTGIYPVDSPGGWRLIGHTCLQLVDFRSESPFLFSPGDEVRFLPSPHVA